MNIAAGNTTTIRRDTHYFLNRALEPIREFLDDPRVVEIAVNKPGHVYVERFGADYMEHHLIDALTGDEIQNIGERVAAATNQFISRSKPILSAALPTGERIQIVLPPEAVTFDGPEAYVFRQNGDVFQRVGVHVAYSDPTAVVVANDGQIGPGMFVAQSGAAALNRAVKAALAGGAGGGHEGHDHAH